MAESSTPFQQRIVAGFAKAAADRRSVGELVAAAYAEQDMEYGDPGWTWALPALLIRSSPELHGLAAGLLRSADPDMRRLGVRVMAGMNDVATRTDRTWGERVCVEETVAILDELAVSEPDAGVRLQIAVGLLEMASPSGFATLSRLADDADHDVRVRAVFALGMLLDTAGASDQVVARLAELAEDADPEVRDAAIFELGSSELGSDEVRVVLVHALDDSDPVVACDAAAGLALLGDPRGKPKAVALVAAGQLDTTAYVLDALRAYASPELDVAIQQAEDAGLATESYPQLRSSFSG